MSPLAAVPVGPGRWTVPHNRFDLLPAPTRPPRVSVLVPHYDQPDDLARLLVGIEESTGCADIVEVIVADDGSATPPEVPAWYRGPEVTILRQPDLGFRAAAARNLAAAHATGDVLAFLDADMVPSPGYLAAAAALPAVADEALVVGTRQHWDLDGFDRADVRRWLRGGPAPTRLDDPAWLADGYAGADDLRALTPRSYELVISAVLTVARPLFEELGGFDATICGYGGEDWELAHRWTNAGGLLAHVDAVAHHHGGDWAAREGEAATKGAEACNLLTRIPGRAGPLLSGPPWVHVRLDGRGATVDAITDCVLRLLAARPTGLAVHVTSDAPRPAHLTGDPRITWGADDDRWAEAVVRLDLHRPVRIEPDVLDHLLATLEPGGPGRLALGDEHGSAGAAYEVRALRRVRRWHGADAVDVEHPAWAQLFPTPTAPVPIAVAEVPAGVDVARTLTQLARWGA